MTPQPDYRPKPKPKRPVGDENIPPGYESAPRFAKKHNLSAGAVTRLIHAGKLEYIKVGHRRFVKSEQSWR